ncbi:MAG: type I phosphomannose isomerase catalytic subunit, partial [Candidatus Omnitrophota bacterium]
LVSLFLEPDFAAVPISANDAVISALKAKGVEVKQTGIGSPYVIKAMMDALSEDPGIKAVSWESNGGFLLGSDWMINSKLLKALPTRDAVLPLIAVMAEAIKEDKTLSELIEKALPPRFTHADVIDDKTKGCEIYTAEIGKKIINIFSPSKKEITEVTFDQDGIKIEPEMKDVSIEKELKNIKDRLGAYFNRDNGFRDIGSINFVDGIRMTFMDGTVAHLRPSGNAPEFRIYATADTQKQAEEIVEKRFKILPLIIKDAAEKTYPARSLGAHARSSEFGGSASFDKVCEAVSKGIPVYLRPYKEPKVWGINGIGEYWYGAEEGKKSSEIFTGEDSALAIDVLNKDPEAFLGERVIKKFGSKMPLVKILTPKGRLSVQFHDSKNELWIVTGIDKGLAGTSPSIILGFSNETVKMYGPKVTEEYKKALKDYALELNILIDMLEKDEKSRKALKETKNVVLAAEKMTEKMPDVKKELDLLTKRRKEVDKFYSYKDVSIGDVIPVPSGTLHALGSGIEIVEPQIAGPTQSLEDGETYPVRYYFPGFKREGAQKELDIDRIGEMIPLPAEDALSEVIENKGDTKIERLPGNFSDKGLEVYRITLCDSAELEMCDIESFHNLTAISGKAKVKVWGQEYDVPKVSPDGEMLLIPASAKRYTLISKAENTQIIDTFSPV